MKKFFYLLIGLVMLPALIYAQGTMSPKDLYDYVTANYYTKTVSDGKYATTVDVALKADKTYVDDNFATTAAVALKADKTYVDGTDENIINTLLPAKADQTDMDSAEAAINALNIDNDSQDVQIEANRIAITTKATTTDMDSAEAAIQLMLADNDSQDVTIEANKVGVASVEVGLQTHQNNPTGAHAASAISTTSWDNAQTCLDSLETAIQGINVGSGFATTAQVSQEVLVHNESASAHATKFADYYDKAATDATIEAAIAAIPSGGGVAIEDIGVYIESNTTWEFSKEYDTTAVCICRNRLYQPRSLFTTSVVSSKTRVVFNSAIDASDEIILISNK